MAGFLSIGLYFIEFAVAQIAAVHVAVMQIDDGYGFQNFVFKGKIQIFAFSQTEGHTHLVEDFPTNVILAVHGRNSPA